MNTLTIQNRGLPWLGCFLCVAMLCAMTTQVRAKSTLRRIGDFGCVAIPLTGALVAIAKNDREGLIQWAEGAAYTAIATIALKKGFNARRPGGGRESMPSGHMSGATQGAAFLQFRYGPEYGVPAYIGAAVVGYSRVQSNRHYTRDVIAGGLLATGIQYMVTKKGWSVTASPSYSRSEDGFSFLATKNF